MDYQSAQERQIQGVFRRQYVDIAKGHNAVFGVPVRSREARRTRPVAALRFLARTGPFPAKPSKNRVAFDG